jgi:hypothetical protein
MFSLKLRCFVWWLLIVSVSIAGCSNPFTTPVSQTPYASPTSAPLFARVTPTPTKDLTLAQATANPFEIPGFNNTATPANSFENLTKTITIYDDRLASEWELVSEDGMVFDLASTVNLHAGRNSIALIPGPRESSVTFRLKAAPAEGYRRDQVVGIEFWVSGGSSPLSNRALAVAMRGSNSYSYWVANDSSVRHQGRVEGNFPLFSETRLEFLKVHQDIPAGKWANVYLVLDELLYDPEYTYVTGFQIKNDLSLQTPVYIDDIRLIVLR